MVFTVLRECLPYSNANARMVHMAHTMIGMMCLAYIFFNGEIKGKDIGLIDYNLTYSTI